MNVTDIVDLNDGFESILEVDDGSGHDSSQEAHGIEGSLLKVIPKFFKAIVTLLLCGFLLGMTFLLITLYKRRCGKHSKLHERGKARNGNAGAPLHSVIVTPPADDDSLDESSSRPEAIASSSSLQPVRAKYMKVPVPKQALLRRASGPFGSEALSFVGEQYTMKTMEKEGGHHHHHNRSRPNSPHHFHSGASSAGGGSAQAEETDETKSKWNCFKGSKE